MQCLFVWKNIQVYIILKKKKKIQVYKKKLKAQDFIISVMFLA